MEVFIHGESRGDSVEIFQKVWGWSLHFLHMGRGGEPSLYAVDVVGIAYP